MEFEYVTKAEYQPVREELESIIHRAQKFMKENFDTTFQYRLIGSGKRHLITRVKGGNGGYDFDYNLILQAPEKGYCYKAKVVKEQFLQAFNYAVKGTPYKFPEDSTSAVTIKVVNYKKSVILHSCDLAVIYYPEKETNAGYMYLKNWKNGQYSFEMRNLSQRADEKLETIMQYSNGWNAIREEYLKIKNSNNDPDKHSYILFLEAVNNVYNNNHLG